MLVTFHCVVVGGLFRSAAEKKGKDGPTNCDNASSPHSPARHTHDGAHAMAIWSGSSCFVFSACIAASCAFFALRLLFMDSAQLTRENGNALSQSSGTRRG